jgi:CRP/FNR family transcriptional regulator
MSTDVAAVIQVRPQPETILDRQGDISLGARQTHPTCANCNLRETCLSGGVPAADLERVENIVYARRRIKSGERLFSAGDEFKCLYAIRNGFFKTSLIDSKGRCG